MAILAEASLLPHLDGSCGVTWVDREGDTATVRSRQFATRQEAEAFARSIGLEGRGPDMALALLQPARSDAFAAARSGDWPRAEEQALGVLRIDPDDGDVHRLLGVAYFKQGRLDESIAELKAAVRLDPSDGAAQHNLGVAYGLQGRRDDAIAALEGAAAAGMCSAVGSDLLQMLRGAVEGSADDPFTIQATQLVVRQYLRSRSGGRPRDTR